MFHKLFISSVVLVTPLVSTEESSSVYPYTSYFPDGYVRAPYVQPEEGKEGRVTVRPPSGDDENEGSKLGSLRVTGMRNSKGRGEGEGRVSSGLSLRGEEREGSRGPDEERRVLLDVLSRVSLDRKNRTREFTADKDRAVLQRNLQPEDDCEEGSGEMCKKREERFDRFSTSEPSIDSETQTDEILETALRLGFKFPFRLFRRDVPVEDVATRFIERNGGPSRVVLHLLEEVLPAELGFFTNELVERFERLQDVLRSIRELLFGDGTTERPDEWSSSYTEETTQAVETVVGAGEEEGRRGRSFGVEGDEDGKGRNLRV